MILAGGASSRMGADKATVPLAGRAMIEWVAGAIGAVCETVLVAGRPEGLAGLPGIADPVPDRRGPVSGLVGGLQATQLPVMLVATDQPWLRSATIARLLAVGGDLPIIPVDETGARQTTCAVYPAATLSVAMSELLGGGSLQSVLDRTAYTPVVEITWRQWGEDGRSWYSADTPEALEEGLARFGVPVIT